MPQAFPQLDAGNVVNEDVYAPSLRRDVPVGLGELSAHLDGVGNELQQMAVRAADSEGKAAGANDAAGGQVAPQDPNTAYGQAYNAVAKQGLSEQRRASIIQDVGTALANNPNNPTELRKSLEAIKAGYGVTPYADLNAQLDNEFALHSADAMAHAQEGLHGTMVQQQQANYSLAEQRAASSLSQVSAGASFDTAGATRVAGAVTNYADSLAQYGPREAFSIGDVQYPADPTRAGLISPVEINARAIAATGEAKRAWMLSAQRGIPDSAGQAAFADNLRSRYEAGDKIFAGLDGPHAESLFSALDTQAQKQGQDERIDQASHAQNAENLIEGLQWGDRVDIPTLKAEAAASKNPGLIAKADFYATAGDTVRGVLKTVVARQLGLIREPGALAVAPVTLDAQGRPVAGGTVGAATTPDGRLDGAAFFKQFVAPHEGGLNPSDANGSPTNMGINQAANPGVDVHTLTPDQASGIFTAKYFAASGAEHLPPALAAVHADTYFINPAAATRILSQSGGDPQTYMALREQWMVHDLQTNPAVRPYAQAWAKRNADLSAYVSGGGAAAPAAAGASGGGAWTPPPGTAPGSPAYAAWANTQAGFSADPLKFALDHQVASVAPMIPQGAWSQDPAAVANWTAAIRSRQAVGAGLQVSYGVPLRMLTDAERDDYKSFLASDPAGIVPLASRLTAALGGPGASTFLREIGAGGDVATAVHIGDLAARGNPVIANAAAEGITLKAGGAKVIEDPTWRAGWADQLRLLAPAFRYDPSLFVAAQNTAELARLSDQQRGLSYSAAHYLQSSLGAAQGPNGTTFGGVSSVNGAPTLIPSWLRQDRVGDAIRAVASSWAATPGAGPVYANGQPMSAADIGRLRLVSQPDGRYLLADPRSNMLARLPNGHPAALDFDAQRNFIRERFPDAVRR